MTPRQLALTALLSAALIGGPTCAPELSSTGGGNDGGPRQCIQRTERAVKGLYPTVGDLPQLTDLSLMFANPADRDQTIPSGMRFVEALGPWAVYEITSSNPRLYMPGVLAGSPRFLVMCPGGTVFGEFAMSYEYLTEPRLMGKLQGQAEPIYMTGDPSFGITWHGENACADVHDRAGGNGGDGALIEYTYFDFDPPPPIGSLWPIRMVHVGANRPTVHGDGDPPICCSEQNGCCLAETSTCLPEEYPYCGDRTVDPGEECDDGHNVNGDGCDANCQFEPYCGDGTRDAGEQCDDGNNQNGDGCSAMCRFEPRCGDGHIDAGEICDDGAQNGTVGYCNDDCTGPEEPPGGGSYCGDGTRDGGEQCDDGNNVNGDGCSATCAVEPFCGDGHIDVGEICDDGAQNGTVGYCKVDCSGPEELPGGGGHCGDGTINGNEVCDDGANNGVPGYCAPDCTHPTEPPGTSNPEPNENDLPYCDQLVS